MIYIIQFSLLVYCVLQAYYNHYAIKNMWMGGNDYVKYQHLWHLFQSFTYIVLCLLVSYLYSQQVKTAIALYLSLMLIRQIIFNPILNVLRGKSLFYLSDRGQDKTLKNIFGEAAGLIVTILSIIAIIVINKYYL